MDMFTENLPALSLLQQNAPHEADNHFSQSPSPPFVLYPKRPATVYRYPPRPRPHTQTPSKLPPDTTSASFFLDHSGPLV